MRRSGRRAASWHRRRRLEVPTVAPGGSTSSPANRTETSASRGSARAMTTGRCSSGGSSTGTSFIEWTAMSARPSSSASSSSLMKSPLPPTFASGASSILSPLVRIATSSTSRPGCSARNAAATCSACQSASGLRRVAILRSVTADRTPRAPRGRPATARALPAECYGAARNVCKPRPVPAPALRAARSLRSFREGFPCTPCGLSFPLARERCWVRPSWRDRWHRSRLRGNDVRCVHHGVIDGIDPARAGTMLGAFRRGRTGESK